MKKIHKKIKDFFKKPILSILTVLTKRMKLRDIIIITAHGDFDCNGGAIYNYLLENNYNKKYKIVWFLNHEISETLPKNVEAYSIRSKSIKKYLRICLAKYFFADDYIVKKIRDDQISTYCTHGAVCFKDVRNAMNLHNLNLDYVLSPGASYDDIMIDKYNLNMDEVELLKVGYPFQDVFYKETPNEYKRVSEKNYDKRILWMPTFRKEEGNRNDSTEEFPFGVPLFKTQEMFDKLNEILEKNNVLLTIKIHPSQHPDTYKKLFSMSNIRVIKPEEERQLKLDKFNLMKYTDALISDYSGAAYEYMLLNRPLAFVVSDVSSYKLGFVVDNIRDYMPGNIVENYDDFIAFISDTIGNDDRHKEEREKLLNYLYEHQDGNSCKRLVEFLGI